MSNTVTIKLYVHSGFAGEDSFEMDREEWESMTEEEQEKFLDESAMDFMSNCIYFGAYVEE